MEEGKGRDIEPVAKWLVFVIGFSAGLIAIVFPRVFSLLSTYTPGMEDKALSSGFFWGIAVVFSTMIAVSMLWIYGETRETTKNLFFAALALPAVLSGGMNMSNSSAEHQKANQELQKDYETMVEQVKERENITIPTLSIDIPELDDPSDNPARSKDVLPSAATTNSSFLDLLVPNAFAGADDLYVVSFGISQKKGELEQMERELGGKGIAGLRIIQVGDEYYLISSDKKRESVAVKETIRLRDLLKEQNVTKIQPNLLKVK